ncbi:hypothetical protein [Gloeocapsopsis sp. IPPAS B-1203]|uniref:hypothetical protein n=1 Tax=Gloeocapsopsis sp. IPPAS B-1203 TaxID=2049454 RepID=UPI0025A26E6B|nr:hypothetical protein [Gloeocapsopsis sp. IPPAS B-1203]
MLHVTAFKLPPYHPRLQRNLIKELIGILATIVTPMEAKFSAPAIAVIGNVVKVHEILSSCRPI